MTSNADDSIAPEETTVKDGRDFEAEIVEKAIALRKKKARKRVLVTLSTVAAVVICVVVGILVLIQIGKTNLLTLANDDVNIEAAESAVTYDSGRYVEYKGHRYKLNEAIVSICVIGNDRDEHEPEEGFNGQADAVMVVTLDTETGKVVGIAIPRDSMVEVNRNYLGTDEFADVKQLQLCLAYSYGTNDAESSELVCTAVSRILYNISMDYYFTMSMSGLIVLSDSIGGVTLKALQTIPGTSIEEGETVTLTGEEAEKYVQWRDIDRYGTAIERQARQQQFVRALGKRLLEESKGSPGVLVNVFNALSDYSTTNLGTPEVSYLASVVAGSGVDSVEIVTLTGEPVHNENSPWEQYILNKDAVYQTVLDVYYKDLGPVEE